MGKKDKELEDAKDKLRESFAEDYEYGHPYTEWFLNSDLEDKNKNHSVSIHVCRVLNEKWGERRKHIQPELGEKPLTRPATK